MMMHVALLDSALSSSRACASSLSKRLVDMRALRKFWNRGDLNDVLDHLETIKEASSHDALHYGCASRFFYGSGTPLETAFAWTAACV